MKLLFDQNLSFKLCQRLSDIFPQSDHVRSLGLAAADDRGVWKYAAENGFTLVSLDADFADMAALVGPPPKLIWLRCGNQPTELIESVRRAHAEKIVEFGRDDASACLEIY